MLVLLCKKLKRISFFPVCSSSAVGVDVSATIPDYRFTASSYFNFNYKPSKARLSARPGWTTLRAAKSNSWLKIDLGNAFTICAVRTAGSSEDSERVTKYKLRLSKDNVTWWYYQENGSDKVCLSNKTVSWESYHQGQI